jgi:site-specific DNA-methyltransferase (adenine-specific)
LKPYYQDDYCTIYHGDARETLPELVQADHIITDPPYAEQTHAGARTQKGAGQARDNKLVNFPHIEIDDLRAIFESKPPLRWLISFLDFRHAAALYDAPPSGLRGMRVCVWDKPNPAPQFTGDRPGTGWEAIGVFHSLTRSRWNGGGSRGVWSFPRQTGEHPTEKPKKLLQTLIQLFTDPGELIIDPFMGSGATLRAAKDLGRRAIGIELEEKYCEVAAKRLRQEVLPFAAA